MSNITPYFYGSSDLIGATNVTTVVTYVSNTSPITASYTPSSIDSGNGIVYFTSSILPSSPINTTNLTISITPGAPTPQDALVLVGTVFSAIASFDTIIQYTYQTGAGPTLQTITDTIILPANNFSTSKTLAGLASATPSSPSIIYAVPNVQVEFKYKKDIYYEGDSSYGLSAAIDRNSIKMGWVKNIPSQSLNFFEKTQIQLKYLVDKEQNLVELNRRNLNLFDTQNIFKSGDKIVVSLSDVISPSNQKTLDGTKFIFKGGFSYDPVLFREGGETLTFQNQNPNGSITQGAGLKGIENSWIYYKSKGSLYNTSIAAPNSIPQASTADNGYVWSINYSGLTGVGGSLQSTPLARVHTYDNWQNRSVTGNPNNPGAPLPYSGFSWLSLGNRGPFPSPQAVNITDAKIYEFDALRFLNVSTDGGYYNDTFTLQSVQDKNGRFFYKVNRNGDYKVSCEFTIGIKSTIESNESSRTTTNSWCNIWIPNPLCGPLWWLGNPGGFCKLCVDWRNNTVYARGDDFLTIPFRTTGHTHKLVGILEASLSPDDPNSWRYVASTRFNPKQKDPASGFNKYETDSQTNCIHIKPGAIAPAKGLFEFKLVNDNSYNPSDWNNIKDITVNLRVGEYLRMRVYFVDTTLFFKTGESLEFEIGRPTDGNSIITDSGVLTNMKNPYAEITNPSIQLTRYDVTTTYEQNKVFDLDQGTDTIIFTEEMTKLLVTHSYYLPNTSSVSYNNYTQIIDNCVIQPLDLVRISPFNNPNPLYYEVKSVYLQDKETYTPINESLTLREFPKNLFTISFYRFGSFSPGAISRMEISWIETVATGYDYLPFETWWMGFPSNNPTQIQPIVPSVDYGDIVYMTTRNNTIPALNNVAFKVLLKTITSVEVAPNTFQVKINIVFVNHLWPTITDKYVIDKDYLNVDADVTFVPVSYKKENRLHVKLNKPHLINLGNPSDNFAILRPKPDETSVIIEHRKKEGEVSKALLIPQDANNEIISTLGNIYKTLNPDLQ